MEKPPSDWDLFRRSKAFKNGLFRLNSYDRIHRSNPKIMFPGNAIGIWQRLYLSGLWSEAFLRRLWRIPRVAKRARLPKIPVYVEGSGITLTSALPRLASGLAFKPLTKNPYCSTFP